MEYPKRPNRVWLLPAMACSALLLCCAIAIADDEDTAGLGGRLGRSPLELWPLPEARLPLRPTRAPVVLGDWEYQAVPAADARNGVPWRLIVKPAGPNADQWQQGPLRRFSERKPVFHHTKIKDSDKKQDTDSIPVIEIPDVVWKNQMEESLQEAVGIHFHEYVTNDIARILYTLHKVPADEANGRPPKDYKGQPGVRVEATLLTPITFHLDQSVVVRVDPLRKDLTKSRTDHEVGHAEVSQQVLPAVLAGPQDWNLATCTGRHSELAYYWKRERIGRSWDGYKDGRGRLLTLRTTVVLTPPTRWSLLLPIPPERVTQRTIHQFNDALVKLGDTFYRADQLAQDQFHLQHGAYEQLPAQ